MRNAALLAEWGWAHRGEGAEAFLGVDGNKYRMVAENPFGRSQAGWDTPYRYQRVLVARSRLAAEPGAA